MTTAHHHRHVAEHALSTAAAGPSQAPSAAVDKAAKTPIINRFAMAVSG